LKSASCVYLIITSFYIVHFCISETYKSFIWKIYQEWKIQRVV